MISNMNSLLETPEMNTELHHTMDFEPATAPSEEAVTEQILDHSPGIDLYSRQEPITARQADSEIVAEGETELRGPTDLAMDIDPENATMEPKPIEYTCSELMALENNVTTQNGPIETANFSVDPSQQLPVLANYHHIQILSMPSVKQESNGPYASVIKNESDDSIRPVYQHVKQEEEGGRPSRLDTTLRDPNTLYEQDDSGKLQISGISSSRIPQARYNLAESFKIGKKSVRHQSSRKRKRPDDDYEDREEYDEQFWETFPIRSRLHGSGADTSKASGEQIYQIRTIAKRQMIGAPAKHGDGNPYLIPRSGRASSIQMSSQALDIPSKESNFLRIVKGSNATHNALAQVGMEKTTKLTANSKKQMFARMIKNSPKTSETRLNLLDIKALKEAVDYFGRRIRLVGDGWLINGMISPLLHHQVVGASWMSRREQFDSESKGGMLCDSMGLGKTVETIAAMIWNPPNKTERRKYQRATLIIAASTLLSQWKSEIKKHASNRALETVTIYQAKKGEDAKVIANCDVVLVSYGEVARSCPFPSPSELSNLKKKRNGRDGTNEPNEDDSNLIARWIEQSMEDFCEELHKVDWYRIIIDEAHKIKSHDLHLSHAVNALKGKHRWVLTGTPIMNRPEELYGYFRFLKEPDAKSFKMFKAKFTNIDKKPENLERLDSVLARLMISRSMSDKFLGRPLVDLPVPHHTDSFLEFSPEEGIIYRAMESRYVKTLIQGSDQQEAPNAESHGCPETNDTKMDGVSSKKDVKTRRPELMLIGLNRLRQMTAHPLLVERHIQNDFTGPELRVLYQELVDLGRPQHLVTARIGVLLKQKEEGTTEYDDEEDNGQQCMICSDIATDDCFIPYCKHNFCKSCIEENAKSQIEEAGQLETLCPMCDIPFEVTSLKCSKPPKKPVKKTSQPKGTSRKKPGGKAPRQPGEDSVGNLPPEVSLPWLDSGREIPPSTKLDALEAQIKSRMAADPSEKQIIFTQWRAFAAVLGRALYRSRIRFIYLTGDMTPSRRAEAVSHFSTDDTIKILLATLKTAGEGLNLECANVVYSIDPWYNFCAERQAFCRVYRIGQKKETHFFRLILKNSVDERIIEMQNKKLEMIEKTLKPISRGEMAQLFGVVRKDSMHNEAIDTTIGKEVIPDDSDSEEVEDDQFEQMGESDSDSDSDDGYSD